MTTSTRTGYKELFSHYSVKDLIPECCQVISANYNDRIPEVLKMLYQHRILSMPVKSDQPAHDKDESHYAGIIDIVDLIYWIVFLSLGKELFVDPLAKKHVSLEEYIAREKEIIGEVKVGDIVTDINGTSHPWCPVWEGKPLTSLMDMFARNEIRRVPVVDGNGQVTGFVSQSRLIQWLYQHIEELRPLGIGQMKVSNLEKAELGDDDDNKKRRLEDAVFSVQEDQTALDAFTMMVDKNVMGLAVLDNQGRFMNCISMSDIKGCKYDELFTDIQMPVGSFLAKVKKDWNGTAVTVDPEDTLEEAMKKLAEYRVHRVFVVDKVTKEPLKVFSLCDIISFLNRS